MDQEVFTNADLEDKSLNEIPTYYRSTVDTPYISRLDGGVESSQNVFKIVRFIDFEVTIPPAGSILTDVSHGLGFKPLVRGSYYLKSGSTTAGADFPMGFRGLIPENRFPEFGTAVEHAAYITDVTNSKFTIKVSLTGFEGVVACSVFLFRERTI